MVTSETVVLVACAVLWWIPTFMGVADLQQREGLPRPVVWRWTAVLGVPVLGPAVYFLRGRRVLDGLRHGHRPRR